MSAHVSNRLPLVSSQPNRREIHVPKETLSIERTSGVLKLIPGVFPHGFGISPYRRDTDIIKKKGTLDGDGMKRMC